MSSRRLEPSSARAGHQVLSAAWPGGFVFARPCDAPTPGERRSSAARYLVGAMGCNDCHTPWKLGPQGPEPDMSRALSGHPADFVMPAPPKPRTVDLERCRHQHGVRRSVGRELHREPDARRGHRPRQVDRGHVHRRVEDRPSRGQGPPDPAADALQDDSHAHRRGPAVHLRVSPVLSLRSAIAFPPGRSGRPG